MIVGIDSMVLIYAGVVPRKKGGKSATTDKLVHRAKILMEKLKDNTIVLSTIAVSELLVPVPTSRKGLLCATLASKFHCRPFDLQAASIASDLWAQHKKLPADLKYTQRHVLKADAMIVATAKAAGASKFYSHDKKCRALADLIMEGVDLPSHSEDLFFDHDT